MSGSPMERTATAPTALPGIDPRGPRVSAGITAAVLALTVLTGSAWLLAAQTAVFAVGSLWGIAAAPYGIVFRRLVRPRLGPPAELEDPRPLRFAQTLGLAVTGAGLVAALAGVPYAVEVSAGLAFVAAFLNAAFGLCLGCEVYLLIARVHRRAPSGERDLRAGSGAR